MGLMDQLMSAVKGGDASKVKAGIERLVGEQGGLAALKSKFEASGFGDKVQSWIGKGANEPVSKDEVKSALGEDVRRISAESGASEDEVASGLASVLPDAVDRATPEGRLPEAGEKTAGVFDR
jgi:uncharacterized protein YidB (DUF937 family)